MGFVGAVSLIGFIIATLLLIIVGVNMDAAKRKASHFSVIMAISIGIFALNLFVVVPSAQGRPITRETVDPQLKYNKDGTIKHKSDGDWDIRYNFGEEVIGREASSSAADAASWLLMLAGVAVPVYGLFKMNKTGADTGEEKEDVVRRPAPKAPLSDKAASVAVELTEAGTQTVEVIKIVKEITGLGLNEARNFVIGAPQLLKEATYKEEADWMKAKLEKAGAKVTIIQNSAGGEKE